MFDVQSSHASNAPARKHRTANAELRTSNDYYSSIHLAQHDVHAAQDDHGVRNPVAEAHVLQHGQIDEAGRSHAVAIRIGRTVADEIKAQFTLRGLDPPIGFTRLRTESPQFRLRVHDRSGRNVAQSLLQNFHALAHLQNADHVTVVDVAVFAQRHLEVEPSVDAI